MKKFINSIYKLLIKLNIFISKALLIGKKDKNRFVLNETAKNLSNRKGEFTIRERPIDVQVIPKLNYSTSKGIAIVMQGPLRDVDDFTFKTAKYYLELYPDILLIVSTWEGENEDIIKRLETIGAIVVTSKKSSNAGILNVNLQLTNTLAGVLKAKECGAQFICKTRTDQRLDKAHVFEYMRNLVEHFKTENDKQTGRVITLSMNYGNMFYPYFMSDFLYFGYADDIIKVFNIKLDSREKFTMDINATRREYAEKMYAPEAFIMKNYYYTLGYKGDNTIKDYWDGLKQAFICLDFKTVDLYWPKYENRFAENSFYGDYFPIDDTVRMKTMNFDFVNWFNLYSSTLKYSEEYEKYADVVFKD